MNISNFSLISVLAILVSHAGIVFAGNDQIVNASGGIVNSAVTGGTAVMSISSVKGIPVPAGNKQVTDVKGVILNSAGAGGRAELNIASKTPLGSSGSQVISIKGPVINQAHGRTSIMNIGSSR